MNPISLCIKNQINTSVRLLNQPLIKEGVKNIAGTVSFVFGLVELYDLAQIARGREISTETASNSRNWVQIANKMVIACAKISLVLSAGVSRPGCFILSSLAGSLFSTVQLNRAFGPNTIFAVNPWHPRHMISIAAVILAIPSVMQSAYKGIDWVFRKQRGSSKVRLMAIFNTVTSRPTLHIGNQLGRLVLRSV